MLKLIRPVALGCLVAVAAGLNVGCGEGQLGGSPAMPASTPPPPPSLTGADAVKANSPTGGSSSAPDPNPGARH